MKDVNVTTAALSTKVPYNSLFTNQSSFLFLVATSIFEHNKRNYLFIFISFIIPPILLQKYYKFLKKNKSLNRKTQFDILHFQINFEIVINNRQN